jgi:glycopeptide antibiotics resistance protein
VTAVVGLRRATWVVTVLYLVALVLIAFWQTPVDQDSRGWLLHLLHWLHAHGTPRWVNYSFVEVAANVVLFVPVGLFLVILTGARRWWLGPLVGVLASSGIELAQKAYLPARFATIQDVYANTAGATAGTLVALCVLGILHLRELKIRRKQRTPLRHRH